VTILSSEAFDAALRQWLIQGPGPPRVGAPGPGSHRPSAAVITCVWQPDELSHNEALERELTSWLLLSCVHGWAQRVPGSFSGQTQAGAGLLLVPVYSQAQETVRALQLFMDSAVRAMGISGSAGGWAFRVIGPLTPGSACQVQAQLAQAGWPVS
jgi:hypothetical protein